MEDLRCSSCGRLIGKRIGPSIEVKRKDLTLYVVGKLDILCPKCGTENEFIT